MRRRENSGGVSRRCASGMGGCAGVCGQACRGVRRVEVPEGAGAGAKQVVVIR